MKDGDVTSVHIEEVDVYFADSNLRLGLNSWILLTQNSIFLEFFLKNIIEDTIKGFWEDSSNTHGFNPTFCHLSDCIIVSTENQRGGWELLNTSHITAKVRFQLFAFESTRKEKGNQVWESNTDFCPFTRFL
jgi:hypothetical protein